MSDSELILANGLGERGMSASVAALADHLDVKEILAAGIVAVERDVSVPHVGYGAEPNLFGELECDAGFMDGNTHDTASIGGLKEFESPFLLALELLKRLPHTMLVGEGAHRFAKECGMATYADMPADVLTRYQDWCDQQELRRCSLSYDSAEVLSPAVWPAPKEIEKDTVTFLVRKADGQIAAGTSTSGWGYKYPGRLGDSPIPGAGFYADSRYGGCTCTHTGEITMRLNTAGQVVAALKYGASLQDACYDAMQDIAALTTGYRGPVVIHALDHTGASFVLTNCEEPVYFWCWSNKTGKIEKRFAEQFSA